MAFTLYDHRQLERAWQLLPGGPDCEDPASGETWQYMGSDTEDGTAVHGFRHRMHPAYQSRRVYVHIHESDTGCEILEVVPTPFNC